MAVLGTQLLTDSYYIKESAFRYPSILPTYPIYTINQMYISTLCICINVSSIIYPGSTHRLIDASTHRRAPGTVEEGGSCTARTHRWSIVYIYFFPSPSSRGFSSCKWVFLATWRDLCIFFTDLLKVHYYTRGDMSDKSGFGCNCSCQCHDEKTSQEDPSSIICELCRLFYQNGWVTGTGGGISIRQGTKIYLAPSGVEKEKMQPNEMFILDTHDKSDIMVNYADLGEYQYTPKGLKPSACTPLFLNFYKFKDANACIHTHSLNAVIATRLFKDYFEINNVEQLKAIPKLYEAGNLFNTDTLRIPIMDNQLTEDLLTNPMKVVLDKNPNTCCILVKDHGLFVWSDSIKKAKIINESIDYLLELGIRLKQLNLPTIT